MKVLLKRIYFEEAGNLDHLNEKTIAIIGYGNQGRAQALNLRDSGLNVIIGNREDKYREMALKDNFKVYEIKEATEIGDIIFLLIPDEIMNEVFESEIRPNLKENSTLVFASGYNVAFGLIKPPANVDVLLLAPRMIGVGVRENFLNDQGFYSFIGIEQDATGNALNTLLSLAKGIGTLKKGAVWVSFKQEAELDLFNEQGFGPAFGFVLLNAIYTLIEAGYPPEAVLIEMYMSGEMSYTYKKMADFGIIKQLDFHSQTSQYGAMSRGIRYRKLPVKKIMKDILMEIQNGSFAKEWERDITKIKFKIIKFFAKRRKINRIEKKVRKNLGMKIYGQFDEEPFTREDMEKLKEIRDELKEFNLFYE